MPAFATLIKPAENAEVCVNKLLIPLLSAELEVVLEFVSAQPKAWQQAIDSLSEEALSLLHEHLGLEGDSESKNILDEVKGRLNV